MERCDLSELHFITPIVNIPSILRVGILSHNRAGGVPHQSVAMDEIQDRRAKVQVPGGRKLHDYVNLYFCARNPMMYKRRFQHEQICVLKVNPSIIDLRGVVITDGNASGDYVRFSAAPMGLSIVDHDWTFADSWMDQDQIQYYRKKAAKCAEVLVPDKVYPKYLDGAYVSCQTAMDNLMQLNVNISVSINSHLFFR